MLSAPSYGLSARILAWVSSNFIVTQGSNLSLFQNRTTLLLLSITVILTYNWPLRASCSCIVNKEQRNFSKVNTNRPPLTSFLSLFSWHRDNSTWPFLFSRWNNCQNQKSKYLCITSQQTHVKKLLQRHLYFKNSFCRFEVKYIFLVNCQNSVIKKNWEIGVWLQSNFFANSWNLFFMSW